MSQILTLLIWMWNEKNKTIIYNTTTLSYSNQMSYFFMTHTSNTWLQWSFYGVLLMRFSSSLTSTWLSSSDWFQDSNPYSFYFIAFNLVASFFLSFYHDFIPLGYV